MGVVVNLECSRPRVSAGDVRGVTHAPALERTKGVMITRTAVCFADTGDIASLNVQTV